MKSGLGPAHAEPVEAWGGVFQQSVSLGKDPANAVAHRYLSEKFD